MPLLAGDIRFARSANMADVPEGGGPPSAQLLTSGRSNEIFPDISEETRTVGRVEIYQIFGLLRNSDRTPLLGSNTILAQPPADPNVSVTLLSLRDPFARRSDIVRRIESGMSAGSEFSGFLLENHFETMRSITLIQRPGATPPVIGRTYVLVWDEGKSSERRQRVRIKATDTVQRLFTEVVGGQLVDFLAQVTTCELFDGLAHDFTGSPASRYFARDPNKTVFRETVYSDSGMFYGASPLVQPTQINDVWLKVASSYTQIVPNSRTEVASVDQYPGARQTLTLATTPRQVQVGITPHTQRIRILEENAGMVFVALLKPAPAAGTVFIDFWSLGNRYTLTDDGEGRITGQGSGTINYLTGALQITLKSLPDIGSSITITHGEKSAYTNRAGQAGFRAPEFAWQLPHQGIKPGSVVVEWLSGGVLKTATDNGTGGLTSASGTGEIDYASGKIYLRPTAMIDAGGEFVTNYEYRTTRTENFSAPAVDAGGFGSLALAEVPVANSLTVRWITVRNVSASSGTSEIVSKSSNETTPPATVVTPGTGDGSFIRANTNYTWAGQVVTFAVGAQLTHPNGIYTWTVQTPSAPDASVVFGAASGTVELAKQSASAGPQGLFSVTVAPDCPHLYFSVQLKNPEGVLIAESLSIKVGDAITYVPPPPPPPPPVVVDPERGPQPLMEKGGLHWEDRRYVYVRVERTQLPAGSIYADKDGMGYDLPEVVNTLVLWSASDLAAGFKTITSVAGVPTVYHLWK